MKELELATKDLKIIKRALDYTYSNHTLQEVEKDRELEWMAFLEDVLEESIKDQEMESTLREVTLMVQNGVLSGIHGLDDDQVYRVVDEDEYDEEVEPENDKVVIVELFNGCVEQVKNLKEDQCYVLYDLDE